MNHTEGKKSRPDCSEQARRTLLTQNMSAARKALGRAFASRAKTSLESLTREFGFSVKGGDLQIINSNWYVTHTGLIGLARRKRILRGNWDVTCSGSVTVIPRGPESRYFSYIMGVRRNFVPRNGRIAPYFDVRLGVGRIDAKGPEGVKYAQGQDLTFTINMGSGVRYNLSSRYAISAGLNFMHISNLDLSESNGKPNWGVRNYGINVYGPMFGIDIQLRRHRRHSEQ